MDIVPIGVRSDNNTPVPYIDNQLEGRGSILSMNTKKNKAEALITTNERIFKASLDVSQEARPSMTDSIDNIKSTLKATIDVRQSTKQPVSKTLVAGITMAILAITSAIDNFTGFPLTTNLMKIAATLLMAICLHAIALFAVTIVLIKALKAKNVFALTFILVALSTFSPDVMAENNNTDTNNDSQTFNGRFVVRHHGQAHINLNYIFYTLSFLPCDRLVNKERITKLIDIKDVLCKEISNTTSTAELPAQNDFAKGSLPQHLQELEILECLN